MAVIYRGTISGYFKTNNMMNFYNNIIDDTSIENSLYLIVGRNEPWAANENDIGFAPPFPYDEPEGHADVWNRSIGFVKINESNTIAIYPRRDYGDEHLGALAYNFQIDDIVCTNTNNNNTSPLADSGIMVYKVVDIPNGGTCSIDNVTQDPTDPASLKKDACLGLGGTWMSDDSGKSTVNIPTEKGMAIDTHDGYIWEYMYTIPPDVVIQHVTNDHIVVPFPSDIKEDPARWGIGAVLYEPNSNRIIFNIKCNLLLFKVPLSVNQFPLLADPASKGLRQLTIIYNPLMKKNTYNDPNIIAQDEFYVKSQLDNNSGEIIYMENRVPLYKSTHQEELINVMFEY